MILNELMPAVQAAQALTGTDDQARRAAGAQGRAAAVKTTAAAIDAEQKSTDPLDRRIAQARSTLAQLLAQKARLAPKTAPTAAPVTQQQAAQAGQAGAAAATAAPNISTPI